MKTQNGVISNAMITLIAVLATIGALIGIVTISYVSAYNYGNEMERSLVAVQDNNKNILAQYGQKVQEAAQVPGMQRDDMMKVVVAALEGRYGADGSKATFQWIQEQNPNIDSKVYLKIQQIIESGRNEFQNGQTRMLDVKRSYETSLGYLWRGTWMRIAGYPKIDLASFKIVSTDRADAAFSAGKEDGPLKLR